MGCARQSMDMAVKDENDRLAPMVAQLPWSAGGSLEPHVRGGLTDGGTLDGSAH